MLSSIQRHSLWGQVFEIAVKRGVLTALLGSHLGNRDNLEALGLKPWQQLETIHVYRQLAQELKEVDDNAKARSRETARHLFELGMGLGQTAMREYLKRLKHHEEDYCIKALWCPLQLPKVSQENFATDTEVDLRAFLTAFGQNKLDYALTEKGYPVRADFLLWLEPSNNEGDRELLCLEFSLNSPPETADYTQPEAHLAELYSFARFMESRSVFSRVCAEVSGEEFKLSPLITKYLPAFTSRDKPFYKLCQAASYIRTTLQWLETKGFNDRPCNARALSITQNGFESLAARFFIPDETDPRQHLMSSLGQAYCETEKTPDCNEEVLNDYIRSAFDAIRKALPSTIRKQLAEMSERPNYDHSLAFTISENVENFLNPMDKIPLQQALSWVESDASVTDFLKSDPKALIADALAPKQEVTLRDLHAAAIGAGMRSSIRGQITVLGLEGNPGIGKTTAVVNYLKEANDGFLFLYVSPRVIINDDVTENLAKSASDILTLTTNSKLIGAAKTYHEQQVREGKLTKQFIDSAVVVDGIAGLNVSASSTLILNPVEKEALEQIHIGSSHRKHAETERLDRMETVPQAGVLKVLANTTRTLLADNPELNKVVLTAAIQGYRELDGGKNTVNALDNLFENSLDINAGIKERRVFAQRISTIVVMVDELTGDGAGAPIIHALTKWLTQQFITQFKHEPLFKVILVISDASLGNEIVLNTYLNSGERAPDKVLIAKSQGNTAFRLAATNIRLGSKSLPVLHIMTNSYPAAKLAIDYRVRLDLVKPIEQPDGKMQTLRKAIAEQQGEATLNNIIQEIRNALAASAEQIIFFAQDKKLLRLIEKRLTHSEEKSSLLARHQVAILDSSVLSAKRKALITDKHRDSIKVFLMTSSAARGVSFPKTDWIIALIPRFNIEAALMEIAQLIYRGRGKNYTADNGSVKEDGDHKKRRLVMLLQDFLPVNDTPEPRQWLRQVSDLLTYLVMLRATIYTRITGDAGLDTQKLALIPVGGIGTEEMLSLMSTSVREFLQEADVLLHDNSVTDEQRGRCADAQKHIQHLFSKFSLEGAAKERGFKSVTRIKDSQRFSEYASADNASLLISPSEHPDSLLPKHLYCVGAFWLEHWQDMEKQEQFSVEGWLTNVGQQSQTLLAELRSIHEDQDLPYKLRHPAEELYKILVRNKDELTREFSTVKTLKSPSTWIAIPIDTARFWKKNAEGEMPSLGDESAWRNSLGACLAARAVLPVIPRYADIPYAASVGEQDPTRLDLIFDNRYLGVSNELNLLNTILLSE